MGSQIAGMSDISRKDKERTIFWTGINAPDTMPKQNYIQSRCMRKGEHDQYYSSNEEIH